MNTGKSDLKKKRRTVSFEPDKNIAEMLEKAKNAGLDKGEIVNESLLKCGLEVIRDLAEKKAKALVQLSFNQAEFELTGIAA